MNIDPLVETTFLRIWRDNDQLLSRNLIRRHIKTADNSINALLRDLNRWAAIPARAYRVSRVPSAIAGLQEVLPETVAMDVIKELFSGNGAPESVDLDKCCRHWWPEQYDEDDDGSDDDEPNSD